MMQSTHIDKIGPSTSARHTTINTSDDLSGPKRSCQYCGAFIDDEDVLRNHSKIAHEIDTDNSNPALKANVNMSIRHGGNEADTAGASADSTDSSEEDEDNDNDNEERDAEEEDSDEDEEDGGSDEDCDDEESSDKDSNESNENGSAAGPHDYNPFNMNTTSPKCGVCSESFSGIPEIVYHLEEADCDSDFDEDKMRLLAFRDNLHDVQSNWYNWETPFICPKCPEGHHHERVSGLLSNIEGGLRGQRYDYEILHFLRELEGDWGGLGDCILRASQA
jgi:hypothetical protein